MDCSKMAIQVCSIRGVPLKLHVLLPAVALLAALGAFLAGGGWIGALLTFLVSGPFLLCTVLVHEMGHVLAARRCNLTADHILLWPLGGLAVIGTGSATSKEQIFISAAGPVTHLPMLLMWAGLLFAVNGGKFTLSLADMYLESDFMAIICVRLFTDNLIMLCFNLLVPCFPLDCSQILVSSLLLRGYDPSFAAKVIVCLSAPVILVLAGLGILAYFTGSPAAIMNLFMAIWLAQQTVRLHNLRVSGELVTHPLFSKPPPADRPAVNGTVLGASGATASRLCGGTLLSFIGALEAVWQTSAQIR
ncbi:unnamed protein product [Polarella glacialis]|nr:unnamed protein product [Polarella glacialis]